MPAVSSISAIGAVLSSLIIVFSAIGLTMHDEFYSGQCRKDYWVYYTNQSNLLVFVYFTLIAPVLYRIHALRPLIAHMEYAVTLCILLTHIVYHRFLSPFAAQKTIYTPDAFFSPVSRADSVVQHYVVPLLTLAYWLICSPQKHTLGAGDALYWLAFPISYAIFVLIRGKHRGNIHQTRSAYPYPFLDAALLGKRRMMRFLILLFFLCAAGGFALVFAVRAVYFAAALLDR